MDIEYTNFNGMHIFFSVGGDNKVKAFSLSPDFTSLFPQGE
jgi:hypothetical protein